MAYHKYLDNNTYQLLNYYFIDEDCIETWGKDFSKRLIDVVITAINDADAVFMYREHKHKWDEEDNLVEWMRNAKTFEVNKITLQLPNDKMIIVPENNEKVMCLDFTTNKNRKRFKEKFKIDIGMVSIDKRKSLLKENELFTESPIDPYNLLFVRDGWVLMWADFHRFDFWVCSGEKAWNKQ